MGTKLHSCARAMLIGLVGVVASATVWAHGASSKLHGEVTATERQAFEEARPAFERHCFRCHSKDGPKDGKTSTKAKAQARAHVDMTSYPFGGHHAGEAGPAILTALGLGPEHKRATMPSDDPGSVTDEDLRLIRAWAEAFSVAHPPDVRSPQ
jgi:hypothetical protein